MFRSIIERLQWARADQTGSVIVIALLLMVVMTLVGVTGTDTVITENMIIRNVGLHQQNVNLVEAAVMEGFQDVLVTSSDRLEQTSRGTGVSVLPWKNDIDIWDGSGGSLGTEFCDPSTDRVLTSSSTAFAPAINWTVPDSIQDGDISILNKRGETGGQNLRIALLGWDRIGSLTPGNTIYVGFLLAEYLSDNYGMQRLVVRFRDI